MSQQLSRLIGSDHRAKEVGEWAGKWRSNFILSTDSCFKGCLKQIQIAVLSSLSIKSVTTIEQLERIWQRFKGTKIQHQVTLLLS